MNERRELTWKDVVFWAILIGGFCFAIWTFSPRAACAAERPGWSAQKDVPLPKTSIADVLRTHAPWNKTDKVLLGMMIACQAADAATTWVVLDQGGRELNPIMPKSKEGILGVKVGITALSVAVAYFVDDPEARRLTLLIGSIPSCGAAAWNATQIR